MYPTLINLPPHLAVPAYQSLLLLSVLICLLIGPRSIEAQEGIARAKTVRVLGLLTVAAFAGGRIHFVANQWHLYADHPINAFNVWSGGLHAGGAIVLLAVALPLVLHHYHIPVARFTDAFVPTIGVGIAIARVGCFLHGCCFGTPCHWPWCISFPRETSIYQIHFSLGLLPAGATQTAPIHPLQLYFAAVGLAISVFAIWWRPRRRYPGQVALVALNLFAISSAVLELFRADHDGRIYWGPLPQLEWTAIAMSVVAAAALLTAERIHRRVPVIATSLAARAT